MRRVALIHWNAQEAAERLSQLRTAGFAPTHYLVDHAVSLKPLETDPPSAIVVDLGRLPSHGRSVALYFRQKKATRHVPLVFVDGEAAKVGKIRALLPDATYATSRGLADALKRAIAGAAAKSSPKLVVPGPNAGYSGTPLPKKVGIRAGDAVALLNAPDGFKKLLGALPDGARVVANARAASAQRVLVFLRSRAEMAKRLGAAERAMADGGALWFCWPKKASGVATDLSEDSIRAYGLANALVDYKVCAIDATWSGLCFARKKAKPN